MSRWIINALNALKDPNAVKLGIQKTGIRGLKLINMFCAIHLFTEYVGRPSTMAGPSMLPTLATHGEIVIEDRITYRFNLSSLSRGDLVTLKSPVNPAHIICKRVIGLPGDTICVDPTGNKAPSSEHVLIPKGHVWISGDNAANSRDSRDYGPVPISLIQARLYARVWPLKDWTIFRNPVRVIE